MTAANASAADFFGDVRRLETAIHRTFRHLQRNPDAALSLAYTTATDLRKTA